MLGWAACRLAAVMLYGILGQAQAVTNYTVQTANDLAYGIWSQADIIYIAESIQITLDNYPTSSIHVVNHSTTIMPHPAVANTTPISVDFGNLITNRVILTEGSNVTLLNLRVVNFYFPVNEDLAVSSFIPFFSFDATSNLICINDDFAVDPSRCASQPNYPEFVGEAREAWLVSTHPEEFEGSLVNDTYYVDSAVAPINYFRVNLTTILGEPTAGQCFITLCRWTCEVTELPTSKYSIMSRAYTSNDVLQALNFVDSRTIYLTANITTPDQSWGPDALTVANFRLVNIAGDLSQQTPIYWNLQQQADLLQVGYGGTLTLQGLTLTLASPCCSQISNQLGSWFFQEDELGWQVFDVVLPSAINVQPVRVPILTPPAHFMANDVAFIYESCDADAFPAAMADMARLAAENETVGQQPQQFSYNPATRTLFCEYCLWEAAQTCPAQYDGAVSTAELTNSTVRCKTFREPPPPPPAAAVGVLQRQGGPNGAAAGWSPSVIVVVVVVLGASAIAALLVCIVYRVHRARRRRMRGGAPVGAFTAISADKANSGALESTALPMGSVSEASRFGPGEPHFLGSAPSGSV